MEIEKKSLRKDALRERRALADTCVRQRSGAILAKLIAMPQYETAKTIMCYAAMRDEVQTYALIEHAAALGKRVCIPYIREGAAGAMEAALVAGIGDLVAGKYGILTVREENLRFVAPELIDLALLPGVAFGKHGERLGMGAGFYDRFLPRARNAILAGIAFACQIRDEIPTMAHDCLVDYVVTEEEIIDCKTGKM